MVQTDKWSRSHNLGKGLHNHPTPPQKRKITKYSPKQAWHWQFYSFVKTFCNTFDKYHWYGDIAIDIILHPLPSQPPTQECVEKRLISSTWSTQMINMQESSSYHIASQHKTYMRQETKLCMNTKT